MKIKTLISLLVLCAIAFLAYFIISANSSSQTTNEPNSYVYVDQNDIDSVRVFTFDASLQDEVSLTYSSKIGWCLDHNEHIPLKNTETRAIISAFSTVVATQKVESASSDLSEYGLDNPSYNVSIKALGNTKHYYFGDFNKSLNSYYFKTDQSSTIYLVPANYIENLKISIIDLLNPNELPNLNNIQSATVTSVSGAVTVADEALISALSSLSIDYPVSCGEINYHTFSLDTPATALIEYLDQNQEAKSITLYFGRGASDQITYIISPNTQIVCVLKCENIQALISAIDAKT